MTVIAVLADPPRPGVALPELAASGPLDEAEAADLYAAALKDAFVAAAESGGDLLVNYRADEDVPGEGDAEAELRAVAASALGGAEGVRFEVQVGSTFAARAGNTATHLLREGGAGSVLLTRGDAPFLSRSVVDSTAMKLRSAPVVLGPAPGGRLHFAAFAEPIDFEGAFADPELRTLARRAGDAGRAVDFGAMQPVIRRGEDLRTLLPLLAARRAGGRTLPEHTAAAVDDLGLDVVVEEGRERVVGGSDRS